MATLMVGERKQSASPMTVYLSFGHHFAWEAAS
jgi:hypothetical protein